MRKQGVKALNELEEYYNDESQVDQPLKVSTYDISASPNDFNIRTLYDFIESGALIIPGFQRNYVWDLNRASRLIESILIGLPVPQIFLYEESKNNYLVIDGQQRLMSIYYFVKQRFPRKEKVIELRKIYGENGCIPDEVLSDDNYFRNFKLYLPELMPEDTNPFHGLTYSTLADNKITFDLCTIRNVIIKQNSPSNDDSSIYEIFNRLNSGGMNLRPQEVRASLYHSRMYNLLFKFNNDPRWRVLMSSTEADLHMRDVEILLRSFAMLMDSDNYKTPMAAFLNNFSKKCKTISEDQVIYLDLLFNKFLNSCNRLEDKAFFGGKKQFSTLVFESVFVAVCAETYEHRKTSIQEITNEKLGKLFGNDEFNKACQSNTANKSYMRKRLEIAKKIFAG